MKGCLEDLARVLRKSFIIAGSFVAEKLRAAVVPKMKPLAYNDIDVYVCRNFDEGKEQVRTTYSKISKLGGARNVNLVVCENNTATRIVNECDVNATATAIHVKVENHGVHSVRFVVSESFWRFLEDPCHFLYPLQNKVRFY